ncbi:glycosyltransferase [Methylorubrum populi]|nr:glycosyltransferase [Methylorubrum populi]
MTKAINVMVMDTEYQTNNRYIINDLLEALSTHDDVARAELVDYMSIHQTICEGIFDAAIFVGSAANVSWIVTILREKGIASIFWSTEDPYELDNNLRYEALFDAIFTNDLSSLPAYKNKAEHLPLAGSPNRFYLEPKEGSQLQQDLFFVGTAWPNRVDAINRLSGELPPNLKFKLALPSNPYIPKPNLDKSTYIYDWRCSPNSFARLANRSRIVLTIGRTFSTRGLSEGSTPPPRLFEVALAGTAQVYITRSSEGRRYFDRNTEVPVVNTLEDAIPVIRQILADPAWRHSLAINSQNKALLQHTYKIRSDALVGRIKSILKNKSEGYNQKIPDLVHKRSPRRKLLIVAHNRQGKSPGGGVETYLDSTMKLLQRSYDTYLLTPENLNGRLILELIAPNGTIKKFETRSRISSEYITVPEVEDLFFKIIIEQGIELVHFHHLLGWPLSLPRVSRAAGAINVFTAHDYYSVCDNFSLISHEGKYCNFIERSPSFCDLCLRLTKNAPIGAQNVRRAAMDATMEVLDAVIFNTESSKQLITKVYDLNPDRLHIVEMIVPGEWSPPRNSIAAEDPTAPLIVKVVGNFTKEKGAFQLIHIFHLMQHENIRFDIIGREDPAISEQLDVWRLENVCRQRGYQQDQLPHLLADGDVALAFSVWPETYLISLSEAWICGLVPIVSDLGAPPERVIDGVDGIVVPAGDYGRIIEVLRLLASNRDQLKLMRQNVKNKTHIRAAQHVAELKRLYDKLFSDRAIGRNERYEAAHPVYNRQMISRRYSNNRWNDTTPLWDSEYPSKYLYSEATSDLIPSGFLSALPIKYSHLECYDLTNDDSLIHISLPVKFGNASQLRYIEFSVASYESRDLIEVYVVINDRMMGKIFSPADIIQKSSGLYMCIWRSPKNFSIDQLSFSCVFDGKVVNSSKSLQFGASDIKLADMCSLASNSSIAHVEASDWINGVSFDAARKIVVQGWAFDPVADDIPSKCHVMIRHEGGGAYLIECKRSNDTVTRNLDPLYSRSGFEVTIDPVILHRICGEQHGTQVLSFMIVQEAADGNFFSSNVGRLVQFDFQVGLRLSSLSSSLYIDAGLLDRWRRLPSPTAEYILSEEDINVLIEAFDARAVIACCSDSGALFSRASLFSEYLKEGEKQGISARFDFNANFYLASNPELSNEISLLCHFWRWGRHEGRSSALEVPFARSEHLEIVRTEFDESFYRQQAFGTNQFSGDAAQHYIAYGERAGYWPNRQFDPLYYANANGDLHIGADCLFAHFLSFGRAEGRRPSRNEGNSSKHSPHIEMFAQFFDRDYYVAQAPYVAGTEIDVVCHYFEFGHKANLSPNPVFEAAKSSIVGGDDLERFIRWVRSL